MNIDKLYSDETQENYFDTKTKELTDKINEGLIDADLGKEDIDFINLKLKEVARDMRHQLVDDLYLKLPTVCVDGEFIKDSIAKIIMNFEPSLGV